MREEARDTCWVACAHAQSARESVWIVRCGRDAERTDAHYQVGVFGTNGALLSPAALDKTGDGAVCACGGRARRRRAPAIKLAERHSDSGVNACRSIQLKNELIF